MMPGYLGGSEEKLSNDPGPPFSLDNIKPILGRPWEQGSSEKECICES